MQASIYINNHRKRFRFSLELYRSGYSQQSNLYAMLSCLTDVGGLSFTDKIRLTLSLGSTLRRIKNSRASGSRLEGFNYYYVAASKQETSYVVKDDFDTIIDEISSEDLRPAMADAKVMLIYRVHEILSGKGLIQPFDLLMYESC